MPSFAFHLLQRCAKGIKSTLKEKEKFSLFLSLTSSNDQFFFTISGKFSWCFDARDNLRVIRNEEAIRLIIEWVRILLFFSVISDSTSVLSHSSVMGNCCASEQQEHFYGRSSSSAVRPKATTLAVTTVLVCLDASPTPQSSRLKTALKGTFGNLVAFNSQRALLDHIESAVGHKYYVVVIGKISSHALQSLCDDPKVGAIYLCLGKPHHDRIPDTSKIRGFYDHLTDLEAAIHKDI